jgi:dihydroorotase
MTRRVPGPILIREVLRYGEGAPVDVLIDDGQIADIAVGLRVPDDAEVVEAGGSVLLPGFVDLHTHLREPGREYAEDIETGSAAAALGGYTAVFAMANTDPVADSPVVTDHVWHRGQQVGLVDVHPVGAVTVGLKGVQLTEMALMAAGVGRVRMFSDDGVCVHDPLVMRRALEYASGLGVLIAQHAEEPRLTVDAVAHEGPNAARLGLAGWPRSAEESIVARDAILARDAGARVHICHASTAGTVELLRWAKEQGISITAEVTPHHLLLDDARLETYDGRNRVNPPLREVDDAVALRQALADGVIDCVATDHAPHAEHEKMCEFAVARPGMLGLQTALSVVVETMVRPGLMTWRDVARVMSEAPAAIVGLPDQGRPLEVGEPANLVVVDPDATWRVTGTELASRSANTPYESMTLPATVTLTLLRGKVTARDGKSPVGRSAATGGTAPVDSRAATGGTAPVDSSAATGGSTP